MLNGLMEKFRRNRALTYILATSFVLRVIFSLDNVKALFVDIESYDSYAKQIISSGFLSVSAYHPIAYPTFIAVIYKLLGSSFLFVYLAQSVLGVLNTLLIYLIARNVFDDRIGKASAVMSLVYWPLTLYSGILMSEILFLFFMLLGVYFFLKVLDTGKAYHFLLCGVSLALSTMTRSINLILIAILPVIYFIFNYKKAKLVLRNSLIFILFFCITLSPSVIRNYLKYHAFIPVDTLGGVNLYIGNNERSNGLFVSMADDPMDKVGSNDYENDEALKQAAMKYIFSHPVRVTVLTLKRAMLFIVYDFVEVDWVLTAYISKNAVFQSPAWGILSNIIILPVLALIGAILLWLHRRNKKTRTWKATFYFTLFSALSYFQIRTVAMVVWLVLLFILYLLKSSDVMQGYMMSSGWYVLIYNCNIIFFTFAVLGIPKLFKNKKALILAGFIFYYFGLTSLFYIQARYRLPVMPFLAISAAFPALKLASVPKRICSAVQDDKLKLSSIKKFIGLRA